MTFEREHIEKIILIVVAAVVGGVCAWMFYLSPRVTVITEGKRKITEMDEQYREAQSIIERASRARKTLGDLKSKIAEYDKDIPPEQMDEWILHKVNRICRELNVRYEHWKPLEPEEFKDKTMAKAYRRKKVKLSLFCDYHTLGKFINGLENTSPFISIEDLTIRESGVQGRQENNFAISYVVQKR